MKKFDIQIKDLIWNVIYAEPNEVKFNSKDLGDNDENDCGITFKQECIIYLNASLPTQLIHRTIVHELTHAFIWSYGLEDVKWEEEVICGFIETHFEEIIELVNEIEIKLAKKEKKNGKRV